MVASCMKAKELADAIINASTSPEYEDAGYFAEAIGVTIPLNEWTKIEALAREVQSE